ncbi:uncharacterized protein BJ171DRAFT_569137 [Polychytrium aggregatum]|uniref:uncharacterized protein n=1 Tax=Polychytrium aggregatum TaxID=110093 RepID=UPI0022FDEC92|nr:uncharacterized protein BJ171DRAFT_569137 [Polychytrium aggregatum]KAI9203150.1 hypothetical protein BJ171DRAFT_569137 [Polychytrium aggregatum]
MTGHWSDGLLARQGDRRCIGSRSFSFNKHGVDTDEPRLAKTRFEMTSPQDCHSPSAARIPKPTQQKPMKPDELDEPKKPRRTAAQFLSRQRPSPRSDAVEAAARPSRRTEICILGQAEAALSGICFARKFASMGVLANRGCFHSSYHPARPNIVDNSFGMAQVLYSHFQHDILTILVTNDGFLSTIDAPTLTQLPRLSRQQRDILLLVPSSMWLSVLFRHLQLPDDFFKDLEPSIDRAVVVEGLCHYIGRKDKYYPLSAASYQRELALWWEVCKNGVLRSRLMKFCQDVNMNLQYPQDLVESIGQRTIIPEELSNMDKFRLFDSAQILMPMEYFDFEEHQTYFAIIRFKGHPMRLDESRPGLLPHEMFVLTTGWQLSLVVCDCSHDDLSDWPRDMANINQIKFMESEAFVHSWDWNRVTALEYFENVTLPPSVKSFVGAPTAMDMIERLDLSQCTELCSFAGFPKQDDLQSLALPPQLRGSGELAWIPETLVSLDMSHCTKIKTLAGLTFMDTIQVLTLPPSLESLDGIAACPDLYRLDMSKCIHLSSLGKIPLKYCVMDTLILPPGLASLKGIRLSAPELVQLDLSPCTLMTSLVGAPKALAAAEHLVLGPGFENLKGIEQFKSLRVLDLSKCSKLASLAGLASKQPKLEELVLSPNLETLQGLPQSLDSLERLEMSGCAKLTSLTGMANTLASLDQLTLPPNLEHLAGIPEAMPELQEFDLSHCVKLKSLAGLPAELPKLSVILLPPAIEDLEELVPFGHTIQHVELSKCTRIRNLADLPRILPNLTEINLPPLESALETIDFTKLRSLRRLRPEKSLLHNRRVHKLVTAIGRACPSLVIFFL